MILPYALRVFKAKYFPNCSVLDARLGHSPSYVWRSLWSSKSLLQDGLLWCFGNGSNINVWRDPWMDLNGRFVITACPNGMEEFSVNQLRKLDGSWDLVLIRDIFNERDANLIQQIPLPPNPTSDFLSWGYTKDGCFSVRTGYMLGMSIPLQPRNRV